MASKSTAVTSKILKNVLFFSLFISVISYEFEVGEETGWVTPTGNEPETYNEWAARNRFRIGDTLHFKYHKDSVLVVNSEDYLNCNTSNPITKFQDGNTIFKFDRSGFFYFISGQSGHCKSGQRLIVRVMHPSEIESPESAPSPAPAPLSSGDDGWDSADWGPPGISSTTKLAVASYYVTSFAVILVVLY
ncbi:mavicyanin-like [Olea europaea var. sylvestris]|uniref:Mavicyanin-like n=1 Tax=Olea europaea subsp. europaea TaxID=158383 RepID=A0A8S0R1E5_OLEEU|nr:mavicyanin-like [Olea europaea var. sylvestris]CAA2972197.1 mavicyanin-like [Olea europaea subsp. europaea]